MSWEMKVPSKIDYWFLLDSCSQATVMGKRSGNARRFLCHSCGSNVNIRKRNGEPQETPLKTEIAANTSRVGQPATQLLKHRFLCRRPAWSGVSP